MKRSVGDDNALLFLFDMPRQDFTPNDAEYYVWHGQPRRGRVYRGVPETGSGWSRRLRRLEQFGWLNRVFGKGSLYEWTQEGLEECLKLHQQKEVPHDRQAQDPQ